MYCWHSSCSDSLPWRLSIHPQCQRKIGRSPNEKQGHPSKTVSDWATGNFYRIKTNKPWSIKGSMWGILYGYPTKILDKCMLAKAMEMIWQHHFSVSGILNQWLAFWMRSHLISQERKLCGLIYPGFQDALGNFIWLILQRQRCHFELTDWSSVNKLQGRTAVWCTLPGNSNTLRMFVHAVRWVHSDSGFARSVLLLIKVLSSSVCLPGRWWGARLCCASA